ncbi:hypothetical protein IQ26_07521 [Mesorhizobium tianshanense]|uniref:Lipoprotein n=1 Tax=Mesorhizobium tianshanense TaxID=39844 RepID=A0A562MBV8_9HYPH|nr:hypothetical protein IQ26_07521 [Mesorhizobium tianshanense]
MSRNWKQAIIGITLSVALPGLVGCTSSWPPELRPTPLVATPAPKVVRRAPAPRKVVKPAAKPAAVKKVVVQPVEEEPVAAPPVIVRPLGGGGSGGSGGGGWGGG